jgi:hypothetical protein
MIFIFFHLLAADYTMTNYRNTQTVSKTDVFHRETSRVQRQRQDLDPKVSLLVSKNVSLLETRDNIKKCSDNKDKR